MTVNDQGKRDGKPVVLITGASGFLGRSIVAGAIERGWCVHATVRRSEASHALPPSVICHEIDLNADASHWRSVMTGIDVVIHAAARAHVLRETESNPAQAFAALNTEATEKLANAAHESGVRRFVFVSSIGVNGNTSGKNAFTECSEQKPVSPYAVSKRDAECSLRKIAMSCQLEVVIVRPPLVYGPGVRANFLRLLELIDRRIPLPFNAVKNRRSFIFAANLANLLLTCAVHPAAAGEVFLASDGSEFSTRQLMLEIASRMGRRGRLFTVPTAILRLCAVTLGRRSLYEQLCCSLEIDGSKAARQLGWRPIAAPQDGLDSTVKWYVEQAHT